MVTMGRPTFAPKITPSNKMIPKPNYLPHPWIHPTYHPKPHPYLISHFATCNGQTDMQTNRWLEGMFDDYSTLSLYREWRHDLIIRKYLHSPFKFYLGCTGAGGFKITSNVSGSKFQMCEVTTKNECHANYVCVLATDSSKVSDDRVVLWVITTVCR